MKQKINTICLFLATITSVGNAQVPGTKAIIPTTFFSDPAISPDGSEIAFGSGGDIWTASADGGDAKLLISDPAFDSRPMYSPDGKYLAFNSTRTGAGDIYIYNLKSNELKRVTYDDGNESLSAWSPDSKYLYFSSSAHEISSMNDIYRIKASGGTAMPVSKNNYMNEFFASPSPDGKTLAMSARGIAAAQWWRNGSSHLDQSEIWLMKEGDASYEKITAGGAREVWPMWNKDGSMIYYVSDRNGVQNLWVKTIKGEPKMLTDFKKGRVIWPSMAFNGKSIVFEHDFKIWKYDISSNKATEIKIALRGSPAGPGTEHQRYTNQFRGLALSPDGKKVAFIAHGDVFVGAAKGNGDAVRVTQTDGVESQLRWSNDSNTLLYVSTRDGAGNLYQYNFITSKEARLTNSAEDDGGPLFSPNGKLLAFIRNGKELRVMDMSTRQEKLVAKGYIARPPYTSTGNISWSPDGNWIAYGSYGVKNFYNVNVVPAAGGESKPVSFLANTNGGNLCWSPNGKFILFTTNQRFETSKIARIDLVPQYPRFREEQFQQMFTEQTTSPASPVNIATPKTATASKLSPIDSLQKTLGGTKRPALDVKIITEGIRQRASLLPLDVSVNDIEISKDGNTLLVSAGSNLYTYSLNDLAAEAPTLRPLTTSSETGGGGGRGLGGRSDAQFSADGKEVYYLSQGRIESISIDSKSVKPLTVTAEMDIDFNKEKLAIFEQAWNALNKGFYDDHFHGKNWNEVKSEYAPLVAATNTPEELRRLLTLMVGELNSSHTGVSGGGAAQAATGRLGVLFDRAAYESKGEYKITEILTLGAVDLAGNVHVGDYLTAIDDKILTTDDNIDQLLQNKINHRVILTLTSGTKSYKATIRPTNQSTEKGLLYRAWVEQQRKYVDKISNGKLGYIHLYDMSDNSLAQLYIDLDAENQGKEGVVVDIRNNNGGYINASALDVITRKSYLTMTDRGLFAAPARAKLGQRALELPTILVVNQHSLSDAEDFTEGYKTMGLGKVVGEPTGGWIIYTTDFPLIDGSSVRMPFSRITDHEGKDMEMYPRTVDIQVSRQLGEGNAKDSQLDVAVKELLQQLSSKK